MEGKVELSIGRYEELTALERNWVKKLDEIDELKGKLISDGAVLYRSHATGFHWMHGGVRPSDSYEYKGRDEAIKKVVDELNAVSKKTVEAQEEINRLKESIAVYDCLSFSSRLRYLFTGKI